MILYIPGTLKLKGGVNIPHLETAELWIKELQWRSPKVSLGLII